MPSITGGCLCGRVRYAATTPPAFNSLCHCRDCQRYTGSPFEAALVFPAAAFSLQGELRTYAAVGGTGRIVHRRFCPTCGSGVMNEADARPGIVIVLAGTLDDPTAFEPDAEVFCDFAQPWVHEGADRPRFSRSRG